jgi:protease I
MADRENVLKNFKVAILATDDFEEQELTEPMRALREAGAEVQVIAPRPGKLQAVRHDRKTIQVNVDRVLNELTPLEYDAVMLPGGALNADTLRAIHLAQEFVREIMNSGKPVAAICHAPWLLVSAGLVSGRTLTSYHTIEDDIRNAGGQWLDQEVVVDDHLVTSRQPSDLPAFNREMIRVFSESARRKKKVA